MIRLWLCLCFMFVCTYAFCATLTVNNIPKVNTGGTTPKIANSNMVDNGGNIGVGTTVPDGQLVVLTGNVGIGTASPKQSLVIGTGTIQTVGIGTTVPQQLCLKANRTFGYFDGTWAGTCN